VQSTGYHLAVFTFVILIMHYPFFAGTYWTWAIELQTLSLFLLFSAVWDFLWIVVNPHFGIRKMDVEHIWWHSKRFKGIPTDYFLAVIGSFLLYVPMILEDQRWIKDWLSTVAIFGILTFITVIMNQEERERWKIE